MQYIDGKTIKILSGNVNELDAQVYNKGKSNRSITFNNCVNGTFFIYDNNGNYASTSPLIVNGKTYRWASNHGKPQSCFIVYKNGKVELRRIMSISELKINEINFLFGGLGLINTYDKNFRYNPALEGFSGKFSDILRSTNKTVIAYKNNTIHLLAVDNINHNDLLKLCINKGYEIALSLDGGGSTFMRTDKNVLNGDGRKIHSIIGFKGVDNSPIKTVKSPIKYKSICLDYGHGGKDSGAVNGQIYEKNLVVEIGKKLTEQLNENGVKVIHTRTDDTFIPLLDRSKIANNANVDLFLSIHINSASNPSANGIEVCHYKGNNNKIFAQKICNSICKYTNLNNRGAKERNDLAVLNSTRMDAQLIECGFISNSNDLGKITTDAWQKKIVQGIVESLDLIYYTQSNEVNLKKEDNKELTWQEKSFIELVNKLSLDKNYWTTDKVNKPISCGEIFAVINKLIK